MPLLFPELSDIIIKCFYDTYNKLGYGFLEKVYENSIAIELRKHGLTVSHQAPILVYYDEVIVGEYYADLVVENKIILELKAAKAISDLHKSQLLNYLKATKIPVGYILNYGPEPQFKRLIFTGNHPHQNQKNQPESP